MTSVLSPYGMTAFDAHNLSGIQGQTAVPTELFTFQWIASAAHACNGGHSGNAETAAPKSSAAIEIKESERADPEGNFIYRDCALFCEDICRSYGHDSGQLSRLLSAPPRRFMMP